MEQSLFGLLCFVLLVVHEFSVGLAVKQYCRADFPPGFVFGSGTSAYQVEGAANEDGRTPSIIDTFAHDETWHGGNGDVACDQYHKYKEDVELMVDTGLEAYRFSISWPRLIPYGRGQVNPKGLKYYNNLINELIKHGIEPHVTLLHMDLPQTLQNEYGGFLSRRIVEDYTAYVDVCFREFGDRVSHWTTINEGNIYVLSGYDIGFQPPQRCSYPFGFNCRGGNSSTEPYIVTHNVLLAHAAAVKLYRDKYQRKQKGKIGINLLSLVSLPATNKTEDAVATKRANDFFMGWYMEPLVYGDYPAIMRRNVGDRLPSFSKDNSKMVKGSFDFIGLNHYTTTYVKDNSASLEMKLRDFYLDMAAAYDFDVKDIPIPPGGGYPYLPWGIQLMLEYFKEVYGNPPIYIHENGQRTVRNTTLNDSIRVEYYKGFIGSVLDAIRNGSDTKGYFTWSFLDLYEILEGYAAGYGLYYVDLDDPNLTRYPKASQKWYSSFLKGQNVVVPSAHQDTDHHIQQPVLPRRIRNNESTISDVSPPNVSSV